MKLVKSENIVSTRQLQMQETLYEASFLNKEQCDVLLDTTERNIDNIKYLFDTIGIKYNDIKIYGVTVNYLVNNTWLSLDDLSSGERILLYILACKKLNKKLAVWGLFEGLDSRLKEIALQQFCDYENLTIVIHDTQLSSEYSKYFIDKLD